MKWIGITLTLLLSSPCYAERVACYFELSSGELVFSTKRMKEAATNANIANFTAQQRKDQEQLAQKDGHYVVDGKCVKMGYSFGSAELDRAFSNSPM